MTEQQHRQQYQQQDTQPNTLQDVVHGPGSEQELGRRWSELSAARASLAEVMTDDELRSLGVNLEVLDQRP